MKRLPVGIQTFREIIENNYIYIDKTKYAYELIKSSKYSFLSRPRRFGKSLFVDTLKNIFEGNKELFKGLYIYDKYNFEEYPVIKIDWAGDFKTLESTKKVANSILEYNQKRLGIDCKTDEEPSLCFQRLIIETSEKYGKPVVILIDEYDKPILDNIENVERALENRDFLRSFYVMMKANDAHIRFAFLTGISKFSKASIFSGLNNLTDISLMKKYGNICGYTHKDVIEKFEDYLPEVDLERLKEWYNGYYFLEDRVYNPFDILKFFDNECIYKNYWWESATPYFLITMLKKGDYYIPELENIKLSEEMLGSFDVDKLRLEVLLYQAGYLTIKSVDYKVNRVEYQLKVPNLEVQISLNNLFIDYLTDRINFDFQDGIYETLLNADLEGFENILKSLFASIPFNSYVKNNISHFEGYYSNIVFAYLSASALKIIAEDVTNRGRIDLSIFLGNNAYIIEFKVGKDENPLKQIKEKRYFEKYQGEYENIYLIGILFDEDEKNIHKFEWKRYK